VEKNEDRRKRATDYTVRPMSDPCLLADGTFEPRLIILVRSFEILDWCINLSFRVLSSQLAILSNDLVAKERDLTDARARECKALEAQKGSEARAEKATRQRAELEQRTRIELSKEKERIARDVRSAHERAEKCIQDASIAEEGRKAAEEACKVMQARAKVLQSEARDSQILRQQAEDCSQEAARALQRCEEDLEEARRGRVVAEQEAREKDDAIRRLTDVTSRQEEEVRSEVDRRVESALHEKLSWARETLSGQLERRERLARYVSLLTARAELVRPLLTRGGSNSTYASGLTCN